MNGKENYVLSGSLKALVRLEAETGLSFEPTGFVDDIFGKYYIEEHASITRNNIWEFTELKKYISWKTSINYK